MSKSILVMAAVVCTLFSSFASASNITIRVTTVPTTSGNDVITLTDPVTKKPVDVTVHVEVDPNDDEATTRTNKLAAIEKALHDNGFQASLVTGGNGGVLVDPVGNEEFSFTATTGEEDKVASLGPASPDGFRVAEIGYGGFLSGFDPFGKQAQYRAGFGFDGFTAESTVLFSSLADARISTLLGVIFSDLLVQLPAAQRNLLTLNLASNRILFNFPDTAREIFVSSLSTDESASSSIGLTAVPEPATLVLLVTGVGLVSYKQRRKRVL